MSARAESPRQNSCLTVFSDEASTDYQHLGFKCDVYLSLLQMFRSYCCQGSTVLSIPVVLHMDIPALLIRNHYRCNITDRSNHLLRHCVIYRCFREHRKEIREHYHIGSLNSGAGILSAVAVSKPGISI